MRGRVRPPLGHFRNLYLQIPSWLSAPPGAPGLQLPGSHSSAGLGSNGLLGSPGVTRHPNGQASSRASVCSFKCTRQAQMISEVQSEHSSYFFQQIPLDVCLSETFCLALSNKNHVRPLLWLAPFTTLDEEPLAKRGSGPVPSALHTRSCAPLFLAGMGTTVFPLKTGKWKVSSCTFLCPFLKLSQK